jgi:hypothetical protein
MKFVQKKLKSKLSKSKNFSFSNKKKKRNTFSSFSSLQKLQLSYEKLSNDYDKLKREENDKSSRLQEMTYVQNERKKSHLVLCV